MPQRRALAAVVVVTGALASGCGGAAKSPPPVPSGFLAVKGTHYSFVRPSGWSAVAVDEQPPGKQAVAFESALGAHGLPTPREDWDETKVARMIDSLRVR
jgi:hypothetical protein